MKDNDAGPVIARSVSQYPVIARSVSDEAISLSQKGNLKTKTGKMVIKKEGKPWNRN